MRKLAWVKDLDLALGEHIYVTNLYFIIMAKIMSTPCDS